MMMRQREKKMLLDADIQLIFAGATIHSMLIEEKNEEYQRYANEYDFESDAPICYIDVQRKCYLIAQNGREFLKMYQPGKTSKAI